MCLSTVQDILKTDVDTVDNISKFEEKATHTRLSKDFSLKYHHETLLKFFKVAPFMQSM